MVECSSSERWTVLDRDSPVPLYYQIAQDLQRQIEGGALAPGNALPTEEDLQRIYTVSRATVRQAVRQLAEAGLVRLARPHGTFVTETKLVEPLPALISFSDEMRRAGLAPSARVLAVSREAPADIIRRRLRLDDGADTLKVTRLRLADGQPIAVLTSWLDRSLGLGSEDDFSGSLYHLLAARGAPPQRAEQILDAANATPTVAALLEVPRRAALLVVTRVTYDRADHPIEYVVGQYRADRYSYSMHLRGNGTPTDAFGGRVTIHR